MAKKPFASAKINGYTWTFHVTPLLRDDDGTRIDGQAKFKEREIHIDQEIVTDRETLIDTMCHEIAHAVLFAYHRDAHDEGLAIHLGEGFAQLLAPFLVKDLLKGQK